MVCPILHVMGGLVGRSYRFRKCLVPFGILFNVFMFHWSRPVPESNSECKWLVETISFLHHGSYKQYCSYTRVSKADFGRREQIEHGETFWFITLLRSDGFR